MEKNYANRQNDELVDTLATSMKYDHYDDEVESRLQALEKTPSIMNQHALKMHLASICKPSVFRGRFCRTSFDAKFLSSLAKSCPNDIKNTYEVYEPLKKTETWIKKTTWKKRTFSPLTLVCIGGTCRSTSKVISGFALNFSRKFRIVHCVAIGCIRTKPSFIHLRSSIVFHEEAPLGSMTELWRNISFAEVEERGWQWFVWTTFQGCFLISFLDSRYCYLWLTMA